MLVNLIGYPNELIRSYRFFLLGLVGLTVRKYRIDLGVARDAKVRLSGGRMRESAIRPEIRPVNLKCHVKWQR